MIWLMSTQITVTNIILDEKSWETPGVILTEEHYYYYLKLT